MTMTLILHIYPLASFCHKVLIALYEARTSFETRIVDFSDPGSAAALFAKWPVGKIPVLEDRERHRIVPESTVIIDYLQRHYPGDSALLPSNPDLLEQVRLWDRFYDLYVSLPMQKIVLDRIRPEGSKDPFGVTEARSTLDDAYGMIESQMQTHAWAAGDDFTLADCAALPALFFASVVHPPAAQYPLTEQYLDRLLSRESVRRVLNEAKPYFEMFPYRDAMPSRYLEAF